VSQHSSLSQLDSPLCLVSCPVQFYRPESAGALRADSAAGVYFEQRSMTRRNFAVFLLAAAACFGCGRTSEPPAKLVGTFRSERPVSKDASPLLYYQFEFSESGFASFSLVEAGGRVASGRRPQHAFSIEGKKITFRPTAASGSGPRSDPPTLLYVDRDKLMFQDGGFILYRR
jgi:hypothetical protein